MNAKSQTWNDNIWTVAISKEEPELTTLISEVGGGTIKKSKKLALSSTNRNQRLWLSQWGLSTGAATEEDAHRIPPLPSVLSCWIVFLPFNYRNFPGFLRL